MIIPVSYLSRICYLHIVRPYLFRRSPDIIHDKTIRLGAFVQKSRFFRALIHASWAYDNPAYLAQNIAGIDFKNPIGLSAGYDANFLVPPLMKAVGFGFMEGGSLTFHANYGNRKPWFYRLPKTRAIVVNKGLSNHGVTKIIARLKKYPADTFAHFPLNISIAKTNSPRANTLKTGINDYIGSLKKLKTAGVGQFYTLNISCPNAFGGQPFITPMRLEKLLAAVDELRLKKPVFIKMPAHLPWDTFQLLTDVAAKHSVSGLIIANLIYREQAALKDPLPNTVQGKLGGAANASISNRLIFNTRKKYGDRFFIIGVGGVFTAKDAYEKITSGANLVALITSVIYEGPQLIGTINRELVDLLKRDGLSNISQAVGIKHK